MRTRSDVHQEMKEIRVISCNHAEPSDRRCALAPHRALHIWVGLDSVPYIPYISVFHHPYIYIYTYIFTYIHSYICMYKYMYSLRKHKMTFILF